MAGNKGSVYFEGLPYNEFASVGGVDLQPLYNRMREAASVASARLDSDLGLFCDFTTLPNIVWGGSSLEYAEALDEAGFPQSTKAGGGLKLGMPMKRYAKAITYTRPAYKFKTTGDFARDFETNMVSMNDTILLAIRNAIYNNDNYNFADDYGEGNGTLAVKRFISDSNSDVIPVSPYGESFTAGTHTHYVAKAGASLAVTDIDGLIDNVMEHGETKGVKIIIHRDDITQFTALNYLPGTRNTGFVPISSNLISNYNGLLIAETSQKAGEPDYNDTVVGVWVSNAGAVVPVWVKPWAVQYYFLCIATGGLEKPLMVREPKDPSMKGILITELPEDKTSFNVLMERYIGIGVFNKAAGAVLYSYSSGTTWADPLLSHGGFYGDTTVGYAGTDN